MTKNLLIFPGGSGHKNGKYNQRIDILIREAKVREYSKIKIVNYPGQSLNGTMSMKSALSVSKDLIKRYDKLDTKFDIIAFCWGACVCLNAINSLSKITNLDRIVLYGSPPYWVEYDFYIDNKKSTLKEMSKKGINVDEHFFQFEIPFEILLKKYKLKKKLVVACGTEDIYCPPQYLDYLKKIIEYEYITFYKVEGCEHVQVEPNDVYLKCIFT